MGRFEEYGVPFGSEGDVIGCLLSRAGNGGGVLFMVNGVVQGIAYNLRDCGLLSEPLFACVACKLAEAEVNFGPIFEYPFESANNACPPSLGSPMAATTVKATDELHQTENVDSSSKGLVWLPDSSSAKRPDANQTSTQIVGHEQSYCEWVQETMSGDLAPPACDEFCALEPRGGAGHRMSTEVIDATRTTHQHGRKRRSRKSRAASSRPKPNSVEQVAHKSSLPQTIVDRIHSFARACEDACAPMSMPMPMGMQKVERQLVHQEAKRLGLSTISKGQGKSRHCVLLGQQSARARKNEMASPDAPLVLAPELEKADKADEVQVYKVGSGP